jgi:hypothetical protein
MSDTEEIIAAFTETLTTEFSDLAEETLNEVVGSFESFVGVMAVGESMKPLIYDIENTTGSFDSSMETVSGFMNDFNASASGFYGNLDTLLSDYGETSVSLLLPSVESALTTFSTGLDIMENVESAIIGALPLGDAAIGDIGNIVSSEIALSINVLSGTLGSAQSAAMAGAINYALDLMGSGNIFKEVLSLTRKFTEGDILSILPISIPTIRDLQTLATDLLSGFTGALDATLAEALALLPMNYINAVFRMLSAAGDLLSIDGLTAMLDSLLDYITDFIPKVVVELVEDSIEGTTAVAFAALSSFTKDLSRVYSSGVSDGSLLSTPPIEDISNLLVAASDPNVLRSTAAIVAVYDTIETLTAINRSHYITEESRETLLAEATLEAEEWEAANNDYESNMIRLMTDGLATV